MDRPVMPIGITMSIIVRVRGIVDANVIGPLCQRNNCEFWSQTFIPKTSLLGSHWGPSIHQMQEFDIKFNISTMSLFVFYNCFSFMHCINTSVVSVILMGWGYKLFKKIGFESHESYISSGFYMKVSSCMTIDVGTIPRDKHSMAA